MWNKDATVLFKLGKPTAIGGGGGYVPSAPAAVRLGKEENAVSRNGRSLAASPRSRWTTSCKYT